MAEIPRPNGNISETLRLFSLEDLTRGKQWLSLVIFLISLPIIHCVLICGIHRVFWYFLFIVSLSNVGGHNIGKIGCEFIWPRLSNFMGTGLPDPTIPDDFLEELKQKCAEENNTINNMLDERTARSLSESVVSYAQELCTFGNWRSFIW